MKRLLQNISEGAFNADNFRGASSGREDEFTLWKQRFFLEESLVFKQRKPLSLCVIGFIFHDTVSQANCIPKRFLTYDTVSRQIFVEWIANDNHLCYT